MEKRGSEVLGPIIKSTTSAPECEIHADGNPGISWWFCYPWSVDQRLVHGKLSQILAKLPKAYFITNNIGYSCILNTSGFCFLFVWFGFFSLQKPLLGDKPSSNGKSPPLKKELWIRKLVWRTFMTCTFMAQNKDPQTQMSLKPLQPKIMWFT